MTNANQLVMIETIIAAHVFVPFFRSTKHISCYEVTYNEYKNINYIHAPLT